MAVIDLANPTRFLDARQPRAALAGGGDAAAVRVRALPRDGRARRLPAGRHRQDHVPARAGGLARHDGLGRDERRRARHAGVAASARRRRRQGGRADRRRLHLHLSRHRLALGPPDLGHLLGVGRAADLDAGAAAALSRRDGALLDRGRSRPRLARGGDPDAGRRGQYADHQVLGRLVEHAAPAGLDLAHGRLGHRPVDPVAAADHGRSPSRCCSSRCISPPCATKFCAGACAPCG